MEKLRKLAFLVLPLVVFVLAGCGGGSSGSSGYFDSGGSGNTDTGTTTPAGTTAPFSLLLATDRSTVDANNGTVLATATLKNASSDTVTYTDSAGKVVTINAGSTVPDQGVTFTILAGPATIGSSTPVTDVNGNAKAIITANNALSTTNVLIEAKSTVLSITYRAYTSFQIVRGTGVITIPTPLGELPSTAPGMLPTLEKTVNPAVASTWCWNQLVPFMVTDSNGNPRVGVPVTLSVYSQSGNSIITIDFHAPTVSEPSASTVTSDSAGQGIFNVDVCMNAPPLGRTTVDSVVYKAITSDVIPITAYVGQEYELISGVPLTTAPTSASFGGNSTLTLSASGGISPYSVSSSNPSRVSVVISGTSVTATLVDNTAWTGTVNITVTDANGQTATSVLSR